MKIDLEDQELLEAMDNAQGVANDEKFTESGKRHQKLAAWLAELRNRRQSTRVVLERSMAPWLFGGLLGVLIGVSIAYGIAAKRFAEYQRETRTQIENMIKGDLKLQIPTDNADYELTLHKVSK